MEYLTSVVASALLKTWPFIDLNELWQCGANQIAKVSKRQQEDSNPGSIEVRML